MVSRFFGRRSIRLPRRALLTSGILVVTVSIALAAAHNEPAQAASDTSTIEVADAGAPTGLRRLNEAQYVRSIEQVFGPGIKVPGRFEPSLRNAGLLAIGDGKVVVTPSGMEQYELRAREIAAQVLSADR